MKGKRKEKKNGYKVEKDITMKGKGKEKGMAIK